MAEVPGISQTQPGATETDGTRFAMDAADHAARTAYGRLLAFLTARTRDVAGAEDALADAFAAALSTWPDKGVPDAPEAWLLQVARRKITDTARRAQTRETHEPALIRAMEEAAAMQTPDAIADERLALLFTCAHPAIDPAIRTPLMLQTVLGLDAARIADVFLVKPGAMAQRLVRAKSKIKAAGIPFVIPDREVWPERLDAVMSAIYGAYTAGWDDVDSRLDGLTGEAEWLARLICQLVPGHGEAHGLLALVLYSESRRAARAGPYMPLSEQDPATWDDEQIREADALLRNASPSGTLGRFQLEAAIQSVHAERRITGKTNWQALRTLYEALTRQHPTLGGHVARAAALLMADGPEAALAALDALDPKSVGGYASYWATRAKALAQTGDAAGAQAAYMTAIGLTRDPATIDYLEAQAKALAH